MAPPENRLARETSPYLRQHRFDPVEWFPWGEEALQRARELDRPLFLSIGYSACHWCHVMAHESFSDPATAAEMNESVVAVKIDREERPDLDAVYMEAVIAANGHGGWPMSVFATPDGRPFMAGTYFPDRPRQGMPSFRQVLAAVRDVWSTRRTDIEEQADRLAEAVAGRLRLPPEPQPGVDTTAGRLIVTPDDVARATGAAVRRLQEMADPELGGFGRAPKFPQPLLLDLLLRASVGGGATSDELGRGALAVALRALEAMAAGGVYDQVGGGFHRYSVDREWLVPHFEKMLYDQALLARVYLHAWQVTKDQRWRQVMDETVGYVLDRLAHPSGALCSAEDADSEGEEGRYYVWDAAEFDLAVGPDRARAAREWYGVGERPNFESNRYVLTCAHPAQLIRPPEIEAARQLLLARRSVRTPPGLDDKVLTEWNAMACAVLAEIAGATGTEAYEVAAEGIAAVLMDARSRNGGITPRAVREDGGPVLAGYATDVSWLADALVRLFELTGRTRHLEAAREVAEELVSQFVDEATGAIHTTRAGALVPVVRPVESTDGVTPSAASVAARALIRLGTLVGDDHLVQVAERLVGSLAGVLAQAPTAVPELLWAAELVVNGPVEVVATGAGRALLGEVRRRYLPTAVTAFVADDGRQSELQLPLLEGRDDDAVYVCRAGACRLPAHDASTVHRELDAVLIR